MTDTINSPISPTDIEALKHHQEMAPLAPIDPTAAFLTPNATRAVTAGEDEGEYIALVEAAREFLQPSDMLEHIWLADFIQAEWELRRLRRLVPAAFAAHRPFAVSKLEGFPEDRFCDSAFPAGSGIYRKTLADLVAKGHTLDVLDGHTLLSQAAALESFDKRAAVLEARRDSAMQKVEQRRSGMKTISSAGKETARQ